jgi:hypothetical protein
LDFLAGFRAENAAGFNLAVAAAFLMGAFLVAIESHLLSFIRIKSGKSQCNSRRHRWLFGRQLRLSDLD